MSKTPPPGVRKNNLGFLLGKASRRWDDLLHELFREAGQPNVRSAHTPVIIALYDHDGLRLGELSRQAGLSKEAMTTMVEEMEKAGLITRQADPDGGAMRVFLTPEARRIQAILELCLTELDARAATLAPDDIKSIHGWLRAMGELRR